jgi:hypothetical protein
VSDLFCSLCQGSLRAYFLIAVVGLQFELGCNVFTSYCKLLVYLGFSKLLMFLYYSIKLRKDRAILPHSDYSSTVTIPRADLPTHVLIPS